jgi:hypothetical protein
MTVKRREVDVLLEIKYCRDTDPTMQQSRAENQHDAAATAESHHSVSLMQSLRLDAGSQPFKSTLTCHIVWCGGHTIQLDAHNIETTWSETTSNCYSGRETPQTCNRCVLDE